MVVGTLCAVVGTYLCLCVLVLASRVAWLERDLGHDRMLALHRRLGPVALTLVGIHVLFSSAGFAWGAGQRLLPGAWALIRTGDWMIPATAGFALLVGGGVLCVPAIRSRLRYETWWVTHLYLYLAVALSFGHQLVLSPVFAGGTSARTWWIGLYVVTGAALISGRVVVPVARSVRYGIRVEKVVPEGPDACSIYLTGRQLARLRAEGGQFFQWRFLTRRRWWQAHPYSLSAAPDGRRLRITVKNSGDHSGGLRHLRPGTRVLVEGPYGVFTARRRRTQHVVALAAGIGITPIRALLEDLPARTRVHLVYVMSDPATAPLLTELRGLKFERGWTLTELSGPRHELDAVVLAELVPGVADADVYVCGPAGFRDDALGALRTLGVPSERLHDEVFAFGTASQPEADVPRRALALPMARALATAGGTVAGLAVVLGWSPVDGGPVTTDLAAAPVGLGSSAPGHRVSAGTAAAPTPVPVQQKRSKPKPSPVPTVTATPAAPTPTPRPRRPAATPVPSPRPAGRPTPRPSPTPRPLPTPKPPAVPPAMREVSGSLVSFQWGDLQVAIKVAGTQIVDVWAVTAPGGHSQLFTSQAIPTLRSETLAAQSADIAAVSGASATSAAFKQSLAAAIAEAGL